MQHFPRGSGPWILYFVSFGRPGVMELEVVLLYLHSNTFALYTIRHSRLVRSIASVILDEVRGEPFISHRSIICHTDETTVSTIVSSFLFFSVNFCFPIKFIWLLRATSN